MQILDQIGGAGGFEGDEGEGGMPGQNTIAIEPEDRPAIERVCFMFQSVILDLPIDMIYLACRIGIHRRPCRSGLLRVRQERGVSGELLIREPG